MINIAIFASGSGTNFEAIMKHIQDGSLPVSCQCLIVDKSDAYCIRRAEKYKVQSFFVNPKRYASKEEYEMMILHILQEKKVDLIVLSGYMRYIGKVLLEAYPNRIINIHPAYLPEFPGAHAILDAFEAHVKQTGVTVHYVDEGVDTGPIIQQRRLDIDPDWDLATLETHVHAVEYDLFWRVIKEVAEKIEKEKNE
ncbi:MAG: phosphoribosylglycinamide formyltransferase [Absicoccus porci]|uniref:Phosphoribosylglycinamide formyltransferase n=1 Tax=Absicoccus porci TaxID=2486576 RepID=A0A3N0I110_9FIRM|nr:phosphoribosylglycinamide formyltransferase [Absicoccus porci]MCI6087537.1 phosphoribosylglycinamide formyltransferase [Absicoccus porci]MDD6460233.1 phosphoribosylglycinamide formyltransferase [Absicoccus porci]MDD7330626.1 phosphoribosylglycinamide formyltransferase [Absicoccus porci]MDY4738526.1 phosphoribosylglycinamide formyltransferase [Absicoccus porci]RNM30587.1 phosphoribosylglycinamide formyltransferase [Absicoccus porci]